MKKIRIENADTTDTPMVVQLWQKGQTLPDGLGGTNQAPDEMVSEHAIGGPTDMVEEYVRADQYLVVRGF